jgi:TolB-like protein
MKKTIIVCTLLIFFTSGFAEVKKTPIAIVDLEPAGISESDAKTLTNQFRKELFRTGIFDIMERNRVQEILTEQGFQKSGCVSDRCIVEIGQLIGVEQMVTGNIGSLGSKYILNVRLVDVASGRIMENASEECSCRLEDLTSILERAALKLSGVQRGERVTIKFSRNSKLREKGNFYIKSVPSGAVITLNGKLINENTPLVIEDIPVGRYKVQLLSGDYAADTMVTLSNHEFKTLDLKLTKKTGRLNVVSNVMQADVYLNDKFAGKAPKMIDSLAVGVYNVKVRMHGYLEQSRDVHIKFGRSTELEFILERPGPLKILSVPLEAEIYIDGERRGITPTVITGLTPGEHNVEIRKKNFVPYKDMIRMTTSTETKIEPTLVSQKLNNQKNGKKGAKAKPDKSSARLDRVVRWIIVGSGVAFVLGFIVVNV